MDIKKILEQHKIWLSSGGKEGNKAYLSDAYLSDANLSNADLSDANLSDANLSNADLSDANLSNADLSNANLRNADLRNADLRNANLARAILPNSTFIILGEEYFISISGDYVRAGCQCHSVNEWRQFSKQDIFDMDGEDSLKFYPRLLDIIDFYCGKGERPEWLTEQNND
jgi:Uncharacterized low-complexity proteins